LVLKYIADGSLVMMTASPNRPRPSRSAFRDRPSQLPQPLSCLLRHLSGDAQLACRASLEFAHIFSHGHESPAHLFGQNKPIEGHHRQNTAVLELIERHTP